MSSTETETKPDQLDALVPYSELRANIEALKTENAGLSFDYEDPKGNKAARSHVAGLRKLKADVERKRKALKADALAYGRRVDGIAKELTGEVEDMIAVHEGPLKEIEQREEARKEALRERLAELAMPEEIIADSNTAREIAVRIADIEIDESWQEFKAEAETLKAATLAALKQRFDELKKQEDDAAELERLRKEAAEREEKDRIEREAREAAEKQRREEEERKQREEQIRKAAEEKARREAEEKAEAEGKAAEEAAERKRQEEQAERERIEAEAEAKRQAEEAKRKEEAEKAMAEARRKEAEAQAAIEAERRKAEEAKAEAERIKREAQEAERKRQEEAKRQQEEEEKRKANQQHREKVLTEAAKAIELIHGDGDTPGEYERALKIVRVIAEGRVPHTSIQF